MLLVGCRCIGDPGLMNEEWGYLKFEEGWRCEGWMDEGWGGEGEADDTEEPVDPGILDACCCRP